MLTAMRAAGTVVKAFHDAVGMDSFLTTGRSGYSPFLLETDETLIIIAGIHLGFLEDFTGTLLTAASDF